MFLRLANEHREFVKDLVMSLQALATVLERRGYEAACYTCGEQMNSANFMVSLAQKPSDPLPGIRLRDYLDRTTRRSRVDETRRRRSNFATARTRRSAQSTIASRLTIIDRLEWIFG